MMLYLIFIPGIVGEIFLIAYLVSLRREDKVLAEFCRVREQVVAFLATQEGTYLTHQQYGFARWLLEVNTLTVDRFKSIKHRFNVTAAIRGLRHIDHSVVMPVRRAPQSDSVMLQELYHRLIGATIKGFFAYTPFLGSKLVFSLFLLIARFLANSGIAYIKVRAQEFAERWDRISEAESRYCHV